MKRLFQLMVVIKSILDCHNVYACGRTNQLCKAHRAEFARVLNAINSDWANNA